MKRRRSPESTIHRAVCDHLTLRAKPGVLWLHPANGGARDARTGAMLKRMGVLPGASDILIWHEGKSFALELKADKGRLSEVQHEFLQAFSDAGGFVCAAFGLEEALKALEVWDLLR